MIHAQSLSKAATRAHGQPAAGAAATAAATVAPPLNQAFSPDRSLAFEMTYQSVEIDGRHLAKSHPDIVVAQLTEALRLAELRAKDELYIENITPWITVGQSGTGQVPIIQDRILAHLRTACEEIGREMPICRLDLRQGRFGIRCYLGRNKPTDHVYPEDRFSDSR